MGRCSEYLWQQIQIIENEKMQSVVHVVSVRILGHYEFGTLKNS